MIENQYLYRLLTSVKFMKNNRYPNSRPLIYNTLQTTSFERLKECRKKFIFTVLMCFASIKGKINFLQMQR
ncbi:MAG: hypothetical protein LBP85_07505, partial [Prevotellaceae bacterium]|nr:hypothetical protein [Prevotellaceae bacterium]